MFCVGLRKQAFFLELFQDLELLLIYSWLQSKKQEISTEYMSINHNWLLWRAVKLGVFHILFITGLVSIFEIKAVVFKRSILYHQYQIICSDGTPVQKKENDGSNNQVI